MVGNEAAADWLAKDGADLDGGTMTTIKAATVKQDRMEVYATWRYAACGSGERHTWEA